MSGIRIITNFLAMTTLAHELEQARLSCDPERIRKAQHEYDVYKNIMLISDEINLGLFIGGRYL